MQLIFNQLDKIRRYLTFKPYELKGSIITILVLSFAVSFRGWGLGSTIDVGLGLKNFIIAFAFTW